LDQLSSIAGLDDLSSVQGMSESVETRKPVNLLTPVAMLTGLLSQ